MCLKRNIRLFCFSVHTAPEHVYEERDEQYLRWDAESGKSYSKMRHAIVIPQSGYYFVYVRTMVRCHNQVHSRDYEVFKLELHCWNEGYNKTRELTQAWDGVDCSRGSAVSRNVFVGQIFNLMEGDHISVFIKHGFALVTKSFFGAYVA